MTLENVQTAIDEGIPFAVKMADGRQYVVRDRYRIGYGSTYVILVDEKDLPHVLPLQTMTGISYLKANKS